MPHTAEGLEAFEAMDLFTEKLVQAGVFRHHSDSRLLSALVSRAMSPYARCSSQQGESLMIRRIDQAAGVLVLLFGLLHLAAGYNAFTSPTEARIWFVSGGFLLITTGLANLAASGANSRLQSVAAASGSVALLILGTLLALGKPELLLGPMTILLLAIGILLTSLRLREIFRRPRIEDSSTAA